MNHWILGMHVGFALNLIGALFIIYGWKQIHQQYWSKEEGKGKLVTGGIYTYVRHPQYSGFILMTLGLLVHWATLRLLIMWPVVVVIYYRLAKREEREMEQEFGSQYVEYEKKNSNVPTLSFPQIRQNCTNYLTSPISNVSIKCQD